MHHTSQRQLRETLALLEEAIRRDPHYGPALGFAGLCCMHLASDASAPDREAIRLKGIEFGRRAVEVGGDDPGALADAAMALAAFGEDIDAISRASITNLSATRAIRNSARRMATRYLTPQP